MNALIKSSKFISEYMRLNKTNNQHMLMKKIESFNEVYVSYIDYNDFLGVRYIPEIPPTISSLDMKTIIGSSFGLLGLYENDINCCDTHHMFFLWNPSIRRNFALSVPKDLFTNETLETIDYRDGLAYGSPHRIYEIMGSLAIN
ncbi:hypothetical protein LXL04_020807 [Taraxacum kok-saghyz]